MLQSFRTPVIRILLALGFLLSLVPARSANAQFNGAIYTVQEGETLTDIGGYFHTSLNELLALNPIATPMPSLPARCCSSPALRTSAARSCAWKCRRVKPRTRWQALTP